MNTEKKSSQISEITSNEKSPQRKTRLLNFIYNSNNRLLFKDFSEKENNTEKKSFDKKKSFDNLKKEIMYKLTSYSQEGRNVQFSSGIEVIESEIKEEDDNFFEKISNKKKFKRIEEIESEIKEEDDNFFEKISNKKKFKTPPKSIKTSYKKTKEHIKTPYKTTKSRSSRNKSKNTKDSNIINYNKSNASTKSSYYWKMLLLLDNGNTFTKNFSQEQEVDINRNCNSVILENPYINQKEYKNIFLNMSFEDNDEEINKSF